MEVEEGQDRVQLGEERVQRVCERARLASASSRAPAPPGGSPESPRRGRGTGSRGRARGCRGREAWARGRPRGPSGRSRADPCSARSPRAAPSSPCSRRGRSGRSRTSRASASSREAVASNTRFEFTISSRSAPRRSLIAPNTRPVFLTRSCTATFCSSSTCISFAPSTAKPSKLPNASFRSSLRWPFVIAPSSSLTQSLNAWRVCWVERREDLVQLGGALDPRVRQPATVRQHAGAPVPRRQLDVGLAEQRLLAQDRVAVLRDRRVRRVELDLHDRARAALVELLRLHLADVHAGHPHVRLLGERRGLRHVHGEPVALAASAAPSRRTRATGRSGSRTPTA